MIRSAPPASAHLAERPVPAPAPMIGWPRSTWARRRSKGFLASHALTSRGAEDHDLVEGVEAVGHRVRELGIVDVQVELPEVDLRIEVLAKGAEQRLVGSRIVEDLTLRRDERDALERHEDGQRAPRLVQLLGDHPPELRALLGGGAHERNGRVVLVEEPVAKLGRNRFERAEVDHVERPQGDDLRDSELAGGLQPLGARRENSADELVGQLGRRDVQRGGDEPGAHERLHRLPARSRGVEDEHLVAELLEALPRLGHSTAS